jgi:hypothetical protein
MAWTQADLDSLEAAIASGANEVRYGDKSVRYQTLEQMLIARRLIRQELGLDVPPKKFYSKYSKGL